MRRIPGLVPSTATARRPRSRRRSSVALGSVRRMKLSKWHGLGNDYLLVERDGSRPADARAGQRICDYHFGVGSDGILEVVSADGDGRGRDLEPRRLHRGALRQRHPHRGALARPARRRRTRCGSRRPAQVAARDARRARGRAGDGRRRGRGARDNRRRRRAGRAHAGLGRQPARGHPPPTRTAASCCGSARSSSTTSAFPERTNVQLVRVDGEHDITVGVWERGAGETLSSGTSAVAASAAAVANGWCESPVTVHLAGGDLLVELARRRGDAHRPRGGDLHGRARRGVRAVRFAKRLDAVPPYLFAELERKIAQKRREGVDVISLGIGDPDLPTPPAVVDALADAAARPAHAPVSDQPRLGRAPRGGGRLLPRALRRRARPGARSRARARRQGGGRPHRHGAARPGRHLPLAGSGLSALHVRSAVRRRRGCTTCRCAPSKASCPTSTRSRTTCSRARTCSSSTTRTTRPARS